MDLDRLFRALADPTRRRIVDELAERDGQTLFELHVRLINWYGASLSRQALSKHLLSLEEAGLVRTEWRWRSKHHFLERMPLRQMWDVWLRPLTEPLETEENTADEDRADERAGR
ncbi:MAG TPA: helix-turn-helix domain-containing protein [Rhizobiaceae bacterium]|nr:helix-turn-helix domain-containing protein [Rhizobiaceae bacterium]